MADKHAGHHKTSKAAQLPEFPDAACRGKPLELFFGPDIEVGDGMPYRSEEAKRICWRCPEKEACLEYALDNPAVLGVWGGTTTKDRQAIRADRTVS